MKNKNMADMNNLLQDCLKRIKNLNYQILECSKNCSDDDIKMDFSEKVICSTLSKYIGYYIVQNRYSDAFTFLNNLISKESNYSLYIKKAHEIFFHSQRCRFKKITERTPKFEKVFFGRIRLYSENFKNFSKFEKKYYRQKINQDFETLEKISKNPEYICLLRAKYF